MTTKLHEIQAEQIGAQTGELFEYQYHQAANTTLLLLDGEVHSVYCEWHDDFVTESVSTEYEFFQVKTRTKKLGPWRISDFFGTPKKTNKKKVDPADGTSFFLKMFRTWLQFEKSTRSCLLVSDNDLDENFQSLLHRVKTSSSVADVSQDSWFNFIVASVNQVASEVTDASLYRFLRLFDLRSALGVINDPSGCRAMIADRIVAVSEVEVMYRETQHMTAELVTLVRKKSQYKAKTTRDAESLRKRKAITLPELLSLLSLSPEGYRELKATGRDAVRTLSRLHRWCHNLNFPPRIIPVLCKLKAQWTAWWIANRHVLTTVDELRLRTAAQNMLLGQSRQGGSFDTIIGQSKLIAEKLGPELGTSSILTADEVFGLVLDMAVEAQSGDGS